ncbi:hypothetical protein GN958_ATG14995 [Phytophthora infestans]|uniref:Uncharacterized protein n=1 Tax=Phytophthora infestans TaxID=4787 RepID=A0A8S9U469_PHYIN|nr:hypothetical protein GN958_ATG14995 [Phytophthora infestans]
MRKKVARAANHFGVPDFCNGNQLHATTPRLKQFSAYTMVWRTFGGRASNAKLVAGLILANKDKLSLFCCKQRRESAASRLHQTT